MANIDIMPLDVSMCAILHYPAAFDFRVYMYGTIEGIAYHWCGLCFQKDLQSCVEGGITAFKKFS